MTTGLGREGSPYDRSCYACAPPRAGQRSVGGLCCAEPNATQPTPRREPNRTEKDMAPNRRTRLQRKEQLVTNGLERPRPRPSRTCSLGLRWRTSCGPTATRGCPKEKTHRRTGANRRTDLCSDASLDDTFTDCSAFR